MRERIFGLGIVFSTMIGLSCRKKKKEEKKKEKRQLDER